MQKRCWLDRSKWGLFESASISTVLSTPVVVIVSLDSMFFSALINWSSALLHRHGRVPPRPIHLVLRYMQNTRKLCRSSKWKATPTHSYLQQEWSSILIFNIFNFLLLSWHCKSHSNLLYLQSSETITHLFYRSQLPLRLRLLGTVRSAVSRLQSVY